MASSDFHPRPHFTVDTACLLHVSPLTSKLPLQSSSPPHHARRSPIARDPVHGVEKIQRNRAVTANVTAGPRIRLRCVTRFRKTSKLDARVGLVANRELAVMNGRRMCFASSFLSPFQKKKVKSIIVSLPGHCVVNCDTRTRPRTSKRNCRRRCSRIENRRSRASPDPLRV